MGAYPCNRGLVEFALSIGVLAFFTQTLIADGNTQTLSTSSTQDPLCSLAFRFFAPFSQKDVGIVRKDFRTHPIDPQYVPLPAGFTFREMVLYPNPENPFSNEQEVQFIIAKDGVDVAVQRFITDRHHTYVSQVWSETVPEYENRGPNHALWNAMNKFTEGRLKTILVSFDHDNLSQLHSALRGGNCVEEAVRKAHTGKLLYNRGFRLKEVIPDRVTADFPPIRGYPAKSGF